MNLKKFLLKYNAFQFFFSLLLWVPVFYEYQKKIGLNDTEIFKIQSLYYLVFCFLEIPTGQLADWLGHRFCLILGSLTLIVANVWAPLFPSYAGLLTHFILIALARSFVSGASSAYLYETLHQNNLIEEYKEAEGRARAYALFGKVICFALVGQLMIWNLNLPYWLTAMNAFIGLVFAIKLPQLTTSSQSQQKISPWKLILILKSHPFLILLMLQGAALFILARICQVNLFQPILEKKGFHLIEYGMIMSLMTLFEAFGSFRSKWVQKFINDLNAITLFTILIGFSFYALTIESKMGALITLSFFSYIIGLAFPIQRQLINNAISEPKLRASILSIESIIDRGLNAYIATFLGIALTNHKLYPFLKTTGALSAISAIFIALIIFLIKKKNRHHLDNLLSI